MSDELWEAIATLADRNERTIAAEICTGMEAWLKLAGNITITETRRGYTPNEKLRQPTKMNKEKKK